MSLRSLYILPTDYCPLNCAHCAIQDKTKTRCDLPVDIMEKLIQEAPAQQFNISVISGGGEPMTVNETILNQILQANSRANLYPRMTTNAYWATSLDEACRRLHPLMENGLKNLVISISESHQEIINQL